MISFDHFVKVCSLFCKQVLWVLGDRALSVLVELISHIRVESNPEGEDSSYLLDKFRWLGKFFKKLIVLSKLRDLL